MESMDPPIPPIPSSVWNAELAPDVWWSAEGIDGIDAVIWADPPPYRYPAPDATIAARELVRSGGAA